MIFSLRCFPKDKPESGKRPKCFCSFTFATTVPLKISCGWFGLDFLQENKRVPQASIRLGWSVMTRSIHEGFL